MNWYELADRRVGSHVPAGLAKGAALIVATHGGGLGSPEQHERMTGFSALADETRAFVVLYPEGLRKSWNAGHGALGYAGANDVDDVGFVAAIIEDARQRFGINPLRVYGSGFSNGAMLWHWIGANRPGLVAAFAACSGGFSALPPVESFRATPPAVRIVHGFRDDHVPFKGGEGPRALQAFDYPPIARTESWWRGMGATISARYEPTRGHEWMPNEAAREWSWFRGWRL